jgi:hypothetical protein
MKTTIRLLGKQLILFLFLYSLLNILALEIASSVETSVSGGICADPRFSTRRWTIDGNPYIVTSDAYITAGCVFTIDPGVCVKFQNGAQLQVTGRLNAIGVEENEIKFTSINDTNCDGIANDGVVPPQKGDWHYLTFRKGGGGYGDATGIFKYCLFSFGRGDWYQHNRGVIVVDTGDLADPLLILEFRVLS